MKKKAQELRQRFRSNDLVVSGHAFLTDPAITNLLGYHGYDCVWIDGEHGAFSTTAILQHIMAAGDADTASLVRIAWNDPVLAKPILEMGPDGIIFPYVRTAEEARQAVASCTYPPRGVRGFGPRRAQKYGVMNTAEYLEQADDSLLKIIQIEHTNAVDALEEITRVEGIDLLVIGPCDLSASYGLIGQTSSSRMKQVYDHIAAVCKENGMPFGVSLGPEDMGTVFEWLDRGAVFMSCGDDISYMSMGCRATLQAIRSHMAQRKEQHT